MTLVSTGWLNNNLCNVKIFDASWHMPSTKRNAQKEYSDKHIPKALFWDLDEHSDKDSPFPHMLPNSDYWARMLWSFGIKNADHIVVYDLSDVNSACRLWFSLKYFGHQKVSVLDGGWFKWVTENRPTTNKIDKVQPTNSYGVKENVDWIKNKKQIDENIQNKSFTLVDTRSRERFEGKVEEARPGLKKGHILNSKNIPFQNCIDPKTNTFKSKSELTEIFKKNNIQNSDNVVFYCGSGTSCCTNALAFNQITGKNPSIYDGPWSEYGTK